MNHETQLDLHLAGSKEFGLLLKLIFYTSFEVITGFPRPFNQRNRFRLNFTLLYRWLKRLFKQLTSKGAEKKLLRVKMSSGATYAVGCRRTCPRAIPLALTKISRIDGLPFFLTHGALRACALWARAERRYYRKDFCGWDLGGLFSGGLISFFGGGGGGVGQGSLLSKFYGMM